MKSFWRVTLVVGLVLWWTAQASASPITGLFNTGVGAGGNLLPDSAIDPHYTLSYSDDPAYPAPGSVRVAVSDEWGWPVNDGSWYANSGASKWIAPTANVANFPPEGDMGTYRYLLAFDLTGFNPASVRITGLAGTDDEGTIYVNGQSTGIDISGFLELRPFEITGQYFRSGINTLEFEAINSASGPTGLRIENMQGTANPVPLPSSLLLLAPSLPGLIVVRRFKRGDGSGSAIS